MESTISNFDNKELNKLRLVFEQTPGAIFILDREFRFEYVNPSFTKLSGYTKEELLNRTVGELFYHKDLPESRNEIVKSLLTGEKWEGELLTHNKNGSTYWANTLAAPYKDEDGNIDGYVIIQHDISDKKQMEISLQESEKLYRTLIESSLEAVSLNQDGKFLLVNEAFCNLFGFSQDVIFKMNPQEFIAPEDRERVMDLHYKRMRGELNTMRYTANFLHKTGRKVLTELNATTVQVNGRNASFITMCDITERTEMEKALRESEAKYKTLVENSQDGIMIVRDNRILFANDTICKVLGYCQEGLNLFSSIDIIHPDDRYKVLAIGERRRNKDFSTIDETFRMIAKNGEIKECETTSTLIEFQGEWASFFTIHDITESKRMQLELAKSEQKYRELADFLPQTVYELDNNGNLLYVNKSGMEVFGISEADYGKSVLNYFIPEDHDRMLENLKVTAREKRPNAMNEYTAIKLNGSTFPVIIYGLSVFQEGKPIGTRGIIVDISERKAMENALRESESKYKTLIENSQDGIFAIIEDKILFANNTFCKMVGYSSDELYCKSAASLVHADDRERGLAISELRKQGNRSTMNDIFRFVAKDGSIKEGDVFSSVMELNGQMVSYITVHDLTETRRIQEQLQKSEEKYRTVIDNATDGIVITQQGLLKFANNAMCEMVQYQRDEILETSFYEMVVKEDHQIMIDYHKRRMAGEDFTSLYRSRFIRKDGKTITVELNARTSDYNGQPAAFIIIRDISDRIKIEKELENAKNNLEWLNNQLEQRVKESSESLTEARTQLINLQKENLQSQFDMLKQQVNPHFLFNSLNVLTSLIKLEPNLAEKFSEQLSKVYRYVLENKDNELVDLHTELNFLDAYIFLLNIRFVDKLKVNIDIPENRRSNQIIPLAMQLLIENAIKHNTMSKSEPLTIDIFIDPENYLNIVNNLQERPSQLVSTGVGLKNIQNRYILLNNTEPIFEKTSTHFMAKVPLVILEK